MSRIFSSFYENYFLCPVLQKHNMQQNQMLQNVSLFSFMMRKPLYIC